MYLNCKNKNKDIQIKKNKKFMNPCTLASLFRSLHTTLMAFGYIDFPFIFLKIIYLVSFFPSTL